MLSFIPPLVSELVCWVTAYTHLLPTAALITSFPSKPEAIEEMRKCKKKKKKKLWHPVQLSEGPSTYGNDPNTSPDQCFRKHNIGKEINSHLAVGSFSNDTMFKNINIK